MFATEIALLLVLCTALAVGSIAQSLRTALPQIAAIRQALRDCPESCEVRFTVREVVVSHNDGKVVPLRGRRAINQPRQLPARAAA